MDDFDVLREVERVAYKREIYHNLAEAISKEPTLDERIEACKEELGTIGGDIQDASEEETILRLEFSCLQGQIMRLPRWMIRAYVLFEKLHSIKRHKQMLGEYLLGHYDRISGGYADRLADLSDSKECLDDVLRSDVAKKDEVIATITQLISQETIYAQILYRHAVAVGNYWKLTHSKPFPRQALQPATNSTRPKENN